VRSESSSDPERSRRGAGERSLQIIGKGSWYEAAVLKRQSFEGIINKPFLERGVWREIIRKNTRNPS
jgi:hypothetical protein